ncbi:MAG: TIR domain-containing protein [Ignavibacteriae bacterium]|nr:TIR domain-containing protein [Ignavibacteriota bacterium]NOH00211.1 TIR domain-containing protein [Ignavibacteriota bacterium]
MKSFEYDIAISFAGEDREHAQQLSQLLTNRSVKVFYDEFEQSKLWGKNLYDYLSEIYSKQSEYCVMFLSKHYAAKAWTTIERQSAQERAFRESKEYILPIKIDDTEIPGIPSTVGYIDLREKTIEEIANLILVKLGKKTITADTKYTEDEIFIPKFKREFSQRERDVFLKDTYNTIKEYFKNALEMIPTKVNDVETDYDEITKYKFVAKVYLKGALRNQCKIWIGGMMSSNSISYVQGGFDIHQDNSLNDSISVEADLDSLYLKPLGPDFFSNVKVPDKATPKQAAEYFWSKFIQNL